MLRNGLFIRDHILGRWPLVATRGDILRFDWLVPYLKSFFEDSNFLPPNGIGFLLANTPFYFLFFSFLMKF